MVYTIGLIIQSLVVKAKENHHNYNIFINKLFDIDLDRNDNDNKFIKERRFEVILTSFSSSNDYRPLLNYNSVYK